MEPLCRRLCPALNIPWLEELSTPVAYIFIWSCFSSVFVPSLFCYVKISQVSSQTSAREPKLYSTCEADNLQGPFCPHVLLRCKPSNASDLQHDQSLHGRCGGRLDFLFLFLLASLVSSRLYQPPPMVHAAAQNRTSEMWQQYDLDRCICNR